MRKPAVPSSPPALLPGHSANYWDGIQLLACVVGVPSALGILLGAAMWPSLAGMIVGAVAISVMLVSTACLAIASIQQIRRDRQETSAGYTTRYADSYWLYWQLDPKTGEVLRRPGETTTAPRDRD